VLHLWTYEHSYVVTISQFTNVFMRYMHEHLNKQAKSINGHIFEKYYDDHKSSQIVVR